MADDEFIQSKMPADNNYGQNAATHASSTTLDKPVSSNFLPQTSKDGIADRTRANVQANPNRPLGTIPVKEGMRNRVDTDPVHIGSPRRPVKK
jgi:hypothetical protein